MKRRSTPRFHEMRGGRVKDYEGFQGTIGRLLKDSEPWWPEAPHPGEDAPDVLVILIDDLGFSQFGCFGAELETPNIDRLAAGGLRYSNFHVTPVCSPTRAALLTGRNHHSVGMRSVSNFSSGFPHMRGHVSNHAATIGEVLRDEGYATFALGKWHLCQMESASAAGPFDQWPCQRGFDRYYGFLDGETDQFTPDLVYDNHRVEPPSTPEEGYHLSEDLVDHAIAFIADSTSIRPDRPTFTYLAFGATHAPHQAPAAYLEKWRGRFDGGWDEARDRWFARQKELGVISPETTLAPRNPGVEPWDSLPDNHKQLACRLQEAFAAFLEHTDHQIGRLLDSLEASGRLDNTLIMVLSDNGASQEGGPFGVLHEMKFFNFILESPDEAVAHLDEIGGPRSHSNYPWGWAQAGNTPFKWYKQNTHEGGVHVPLVIHWPNAIGDAGGIRKQFHYVTDLAPTIYEAIGVAAPEIYRGYEQMPIAGTSLAYTFNDPEAVGRKTVQYFEMMGHRAIFSDGWKAVTRHEAGTPFEDDRWELYHLDEDISESNDLAESEPERLAELIELWWSEATEHGVLPLDDRTLELFGARFRDRSPHPASRRYVYRLPLTTVPPQVAPWIAGRSWDLMAAVDREEGQNGVLFAMGNATSGLSVFLLEDHLVFDYNCFGDHHVVRSAVPVPSGPSEVGIEFRRGKTGGSATLLINGITTGTLEVPFVMRMISSTGMSLGRDHGSPVSDNYDGEFAFEGTLDRLEIAIISVNRTDARSEAETDARVTMARQ